MNNTGEQPTMVKIDFLGADLPANASDWVVVRDARTGLTWAKEPIAVKDWFPETEARIAAAFEAEPLAGMDGWRIPTRAELVTLVDDTRYGPAIDTDFFPDCPIDWFWTSTVYAPSPGGCAWYVRFSLGLAGWGYRGSGGFVRAVRASQSLVIGSLT
jgi:hypothetical protein